MAKNNTPSRVSKHWEYNPANDVESFDISTLTPENLVNQILKITYKDVTRTFMMKLFGSFNGKTFVHHYDTFTVPAKAFQFTRKNKLVSNQEPFTTTFGIWVFNIYFLRDLGFSELFGGYLNENVTNDIFEDINQQLVYGLLEDKVEVEQLNKLLKDYIKKYKTTIIITTINLENTINSDYLIIIDDNKIILEGKPLEILGKDNIINKVGLDLPFMIDLTTKLKDYDLIKDIEIDKEKLINKLWK